jgi:hypothetical protein
MKVHQALLSLLSNPAYPAGLQTRKRMEMSESPGYQYYDILMSALFRV